VILLKLTNNKLINHNQKTIGVLAVMFGGFLWALDGVVLTPKLYNLLTNLVLVVFLLHLIPFILMNPFLYKNYKKIYEFKKDDWITFLLIALFGGFLGTWAIVKALFIVNFDGLSIIVLLQKLQPIFAIILAVILLKEKLKKYFVLWASLAIISSYFLTFGLNLPNLDTNANLTLASMYALLAAASFGSATVFGKKILKKYDFTTATFYRFGLTALITLPLVFLFGEMNLSIITKTNWIYLIIIGITTGSGGIFIYYYGLKKIKAITATICEMFFPISAIILDYFINSKILSLIQWIAVIILLFAIYKVTKEHEKGKK
jgi:drug/metabolite transporter (DMT)-like permease